MNRFQRGADRVEGGGAVTGCVPVTATSFLDVAAAFLERLLPDLPTLGALVSAFMFAVALCGGSLVPDVEWSTPLDGVEMVIEQNVAAAKEKEVGDLSLSVDTSGDPRRGAAVSPH